MKSSRKVYRLLFPPRHERLSSNTTIWMTRSVATYPSTSGWSGVFPPFGRLARESHDRQHESLRGAVNRPEDRPSGIPCMVANYGLPCLQPEHSTGSGVGCQPADCFCHGVWIGAYNGPGRIVDKLR